jgi:hypothetical protein
MVTTTWPARRRAPTAYVAGTRGFLFACDPVWKRLPNPNGTPNPPLVGLPALGGNCFDLRTAGEA